MPGTGQSALSGGGGRAVGSVPGQHRRGEGLASRVPSGLHVCTAGSSSAPPATASTSADGVLLRGATWPWSLHANGRAGRWSGNGRLCPVPHRRAPGRGERVREREGDRQTDRQTQTDRQSVCVYCMSANTKA